MISTLIAGPGEEPVTLAEAKAWCRVDSADEDDLLTSLIAAARLQVEGMTGRALVSQQWRLTLNCPRGLLIVLPVAPVLSLDEAPEDATLQGDAVLLAEPVESLSIDYTAGYGDADDVPADLKQAVLILVAHWFEYRDSVGDTTPAGFDRLIRSHKRVRL